MKEFDRVQLKNLIDINSDYNKYNPIATYGTIISIKGKYLPIIVLWDNGIRNSYNIKNLEKL